MGQGSANVFEKIIFATMPEGIRPGGLILTQRLIDFCNFQRGEMIIDIGCGTGTTVEYLRDKQGLYVVGVDVSEELLHQGKERADNLQLIQSSGDELPFADQSIDGILAECTLSIVTNVSKVLREMNRVLVSGGKIGITDLYILEQESDFSSGHSSSLMTYPEILQVLRESGFQMLLFEDQSPLLRNFIATFIMEHGSIEELWQCAGIKKQDKKNYKLGYYLLVAEKS